MPALTIVRASEAQPETFDWGQLTWFASRKRGNSSDLTVGRCLIHPGCANPLHSHPNCSEVLVVLQGKVRHTVDGAGGDVELHAGDTITIPPNFKHRARNIGEENAVLMVTFTSADRQTVGE